MKGRMIYTARDTGERFAEKELTWQECGEVTAGIEPLVRVDLQTLRQEILGFGGAFTDTAAMALFHMKKEIQQKALRAYFDPEAGLAYNMGRVPIGCCDFSTVAYSHAEVPGDKELSFHSIEQDRRGIIPLIREAKSAMAAGGSGEKLLLYALPWSPPGWMKTNGQMSWGGKLRPEHYETMAAYLIKFIRAYEEEGIDLWGIAAQNEPIEIQRWASCEYTGEEERDFLKNYLIPALEKTGYGDKKIFCWECNKDFMQERAEEILSDPELAQKVFGVAFHWYSGDYFEELERTHRKFPQVRLLATECCVVMPEDLGEWSVGERYAHDMIGDFNNWTCAWMDWNLFLDRNSGPQIAENPCAAPIILDEEKQEIIFMSSYFYIGHFSRYIKRGAKNLKTQTDEEAAGKGLESCAFLNRDGETVIVLMNASDQEIRGCVQAGEDMVFVKLGAHSIGTVLLERHSGQTLKSN